jgi:hypothetical protein
MVFAMIEKMNDLKHLLLPKQVQPNTGVQYVLPGL